MRLNDKFILLLTEIKITPKHKDLPHLESFREYYNNDSNHMDLFWYIWFLDERYRAYRRVVKKGYKGSFSQFLGSIYI